jgi:hypothetical protein
MEHRFTTKFELGEQVYHKLPETPVGMVTGINYSVTDRRVIYDITFDPLQDEMQCFEWELSRDKTIV